MGDPHHQILDAGGSFHEIQQELAGFIALVVALLAAGFLMGGCGDDDDSSSTTERADDRVVGHRVGI